jgi:hypothetical protein
VQPTTALIILEKLKEADRKSSMFGGINLNKKDRDKVKLMEVVHRWDNRKSFIFRKLTYFLTS